MLGGGGGGAWPFRPSVGSSRIPHIDTAVSNNPTKQKQKFVRSCIYRTGINIYCSTAVSGMYVHERTPERTLMNRAV